MLTVITRVEAAVFPVVIPVKTKTVMFMVFAKTAVYYLYFPVQLVLKPVAKAALLGNATRRANAGMVASTATGEVVVQLSVIRTASNPQSLVYGHVMRAAVTAYMGVRMKHTGERTVRTNAVLLV